MTKTYCVEDAVSDLRYDKDTGLLWWAKSGSGRDLSKPVGTVTNQGYRQTTLAGKQKKVHHVVWFIHKGVWPENLDHINKDKLDNRIENLREGASVNNHNREMPLPRSGLRGAHWDKKKNKYRSSIMIEGKTLSLGYFRCPTAAHLAYTRKKEEILRD